MAKVTFKTKYWENEKKKKRKRKRKRKGQTMLIYFVNFLKAWKCCIRPK